MIFRSVFNSFEVVNPPYIYPSFVINVLLFGLVSDLACAQKIL